MIKIIIGVIVLILVAALIINARDDEGDTITTTTTSTTTSQNNVPVPPVGNPATTAVPGNQLPVTGTNTRVLNVSGQRLTETPSYIFGQTNIEELNLSNNSLGGSLPAEVRLLQNLKVLNVSNNKFTGVPAEIGQLRNLEVLDLSNNEITGLPNELGNLSKLKVLNLQGNDYSEADLAAIEQKLPDSVEVRTD
ncbi:leucine-rich repeat domain-containing protein [Patescibacteria group bacterium]|nr:leucine-rich repeat domain-containing protein [Patescibacteria group bacterium]